MEFQVEALAPCRKKISISIPQERVKESYDEKYQEINDNFALPGFRKGHAPRKLLERRFGKHLADDVKEDLVKSAMEALVEEKKIEPLRPPTIDFEALEVSPDEALSLEFELVTKPEFETPDYDGLQVDVDPIEIPDGAVDRQVDGLRRRDADLESVDDAVIGDEDIVIVDWKAIDGESVEARDDGVFYPFGREFLSGFRCEGLDEQLRGGKAGKKATVEITVAPDDEREDLAGRTLQLEVTVKDVHRWKLPEITAEWLEKYDYDDEDELRQDVEKRIRRELERQRDRDAEVLLVDQLIGGIEMSLPDDFVDQEVDRIASRTRMQLEMDGKEEDEIAREVDAKREDSRAMVEQEMRRYFLLDRIANDGDIQVTQQELAAAVQELATMHGAKFEDVVGAMRESGRLEELATEIRHRKTRALIRSKAVLNEKKA